jgi:cytochrome c oxidase subunit 2
MALILVLIAVGSVAFHLLSPWWWTPIASNWSYIDTTLIITFWITGAVFVVIVLFMAYCLWRFRHRPGRRAAYEPESPRLEAGLIAVTALGIAAMLAPGLVVWSRFVRTPPDAAEVEIPRPAMAVELSPARNRRPAGRRRHPPCRRRQSARPRSP